MYFNLWGLFIILDDPAGLIVFNQFLLPLPRVSKRDLVVMKAWVPQYLSPDESSGISPMFLDV